MKTTCSVKCYVIGMALKYLPHQEVGLCLVSDGSVFGKVFVVIDDWIEDLERERGEDVVEYPRYGARSQIGISSRRD